MSHTSAFASSPMVIDADQQWKYCEHLFKVKDYDQAISEIKRFLFFFPAEERKDKAYYHIGLSHFHMKQFTNAIESFESMIHQSKDSPLIFKALFKVSQCYKELDSPLDALSTLQKIYLSAPDEETKDKASFQAAWILIEKGDFNAAPPFFDTISPDGQSQYQIDQLKSALKDKNRIKQKSPALAGILSVIPGTGHLYTGRYHDAFTSFLINGGLIYAAYEAYDHENYGLGGLLSFFELGFYTANFYSAISSAHKYNRRKKQQFIDELRNNFSLHLLSSRDNNGIVAFFHYDF